MRALGDYRLYLKQLEKLHAKYLERGKLRNCSQDGVAFARISMRRKSFAKTLAKEVSSGRYEFRPAVKVKIPKAGDPKKFRTIYLLEISDLIVHGVLAELVRTWTEPLLADGVYSYRPGRSWADAINVAASYVRKHRRSEADVRRRGLYVLRADIKEYTETIPVCAASPLWPKLRALLQAQSVRSEDIELLYLTIERALRPPIRSDGGSLYSETRGIPTGSPLGTAIANFYLAELDRELSSVPAALHARYGDDLLFLHPTAAAAEAARVCMFERTKALGLAINAEKEQTLFFNGAGRGSTGAPQYRGTTVVEFLGCKMSFDAEVSIDAKAARRFLRTVRRRVQRFARLNVGAEIDERAKSMCRMVNRFCDPDSAFSHPFAPFLAAGVTSRADLRQLDFAVALILAEAISGIRGPRAFRTVPYRKLRSEWGLDSLVNRRNDAPDR